MLEMIEVRVILSVILLSDEDVLVVLGAPCEQGKRKFFLLQVVNHLSYYICHQKCETISNLNDQF